MFIYFVGNITLHLHCNLMKQLVPYIKWEFFIHFRPACAGIELWFQCGSMSVGVTYFQIAFQISMKNFIIFHLIWVVRNDMDSLLWWFCKSRFLLGYYWCLKKVTFTEICSFNFIGWKGCFIGFPFQNWKSPTTCLICLIYFSFSNSLRVLRKLPAIYLLIQKIKLQAWNHEFRHFDITTDTLNN